MKPEREAKSRSRAVVPLKKKEKVRGHVSATYRQMVKLFYVT
jgi:hypothetical protein